MKNITNVIRRRKCCLVTDGIKYNESYYFKNDEDGDGDGDDDDDDDDDDCYQLYTPVELLLSTDLDRNL